MQLNLDFCADILCEKQFEKFVLSILKLPIGTWVPLHSVLGLDKYSYDNSMIFVSWTKSLRDEDRFSLIMFCEEESMEMVTGNYHTSHLFNS